MQLEVRTRIVQMIILAAILTPKQLEAQDLEPRSYSVVPIGLHATVLSYSYLNGDVVSDFTSPVQDLKVTSSVINFGYMQTFSVLNKLCRIAVSLPYGFLKGTASFYGNDTSGSRNGLYDGKIKIGMNLIGSPIMTPKEFVRFQEHTVLGISLAISMPMGQYYADKLINLGANRWGFKPEVGFSHREGRLFYEAYTGVWFFTTNNDFYKKSTLEEKVLISFQAHMDYVFKSNIWIALNGGFADGGETSLNGKERNDEQQNWRIGATFSIPITKSQSLRAMLNTGIATKIGQNYTAFSLIYQYTWL